MEVSSKKSHYSLKRPKKFIGLQPVSSFLKYYLKICIIYIFKSASQRETI